MPDEPKDVADAAEKTDAGKRDPEENDGSLSTCERSYYYDDAHGYEDFDPDSDDNDNNEED
jgi:hypothetical protein